MKKFNLSLILFLFIGLFVKAQTSGELTVSTGTSNAGGGYNPDHCVVIWVEDNSGNFVKTLLSYAATRKTHLNIWQASSGAVGAEYNTTDAISGATVDRYDTRTCTWDGTDFNGADVADGTYKVWMELTDKNSTGNYSSFSFVKGPAPDQQTPANVPSFSSISINWVPDVAPVMPVVSSILSTPSNPKSTNDVTISATITDDVSVSSADLNWGISSGALNNTLSMSSNGDTYSATVPAQADGVTVYYSISAVDGSGNTGSSSEASYNVSDATYIMFADYDNTKLTFAGFGNASFAEVANPDAAGINTSSLVGQCTKATPAETWAGIYSTQLSSKLDFTTINKFRIKVYSPVACTVLLKLEDSANADVNTEISASATLVNEWEEIMFDFSAEASNTYDKIVLFFDFGTTNANVFYFDDLLISEDVVTVNTQIEQGSITVFPNPVEEGLITITTQGSVSNTIALTNMQGQVLRQMTFSNNESIVMDVRSLNAGMYLLRTSFGNTNIIEKIVVR